MATVTVEPGAAGVSYQSDEQRWQAVTRRDARADGVFWFAVLTTGVYCRPSCPARRARRENVRFFERPEAAEAAGYRPCKRCRPEGAAPSRVEAVARACRLIETAPTPPDLAALAEAAGLSRHHFHRVFKAVTGVTPKAYADGHRAGRVRDKLAAGRPVTEALFDAGYGSSGRFYAEANDQLGMAPSAFRDGGRGVTLRFAVGQTALGAILVAATDRGVCDIRLGEDPDALVTAIQARFPEARLVGADPEFEQWMARVVGLVDAPEDASGLPLDIQGTAFQQRVWQALRAIPPGRTFSYAEIAAAIGRPTAARAVATACAANTLALAIPCHRVVRADGGLGGYRWGVARKRALLEREGAL